MTQQRRTLIRRDLKFFYGEDFAATIRLYEDPLLERWRGTWSPFRVYAPGEGVEWKEEAYVAKLTTEHSEPGSPGSTAFWSALKPAPLSTAKAITLEIDGVYAYSPAFAGGTVELAVAHANFATAPSSAKYRLAVTDATNTTTYPVRGTALFRRP